jgi:perosamine synthetase
MTISSGTGSPWKVPLSGVSVSQAEIASVLTALDAGEVSGTAGDVGRFEKSLGLITGRRRAVAVNSGTSALEITLAAVGVGPGDEVIVPALTFAAPAAAARSLGADVVLCDVDPGSWTISPESCAAAMSRRTRAIVAVDVFGQPCNFDALAALGPPVVEDAAEAFGAEYRGRPCGAHGVAAILSFHANKTVATGEGGAVLTDDDELAERVARLSAHGMRPGGGYRHGVAGRNVRMANLVAAFGVAQLSRWRELTARRNTIAAGYRGLLGDLPLGYANPVDGGRPSCWLFTAATDRRDDLLRHLRNRSIDARAIWPSLDEQPFLASARTTDLTTARSLARECFWLPTFHDLTDEQIEWVAESVVSFFHVPTSAAHPGET